MPSRRLIAAVALITLVTAAQVTVLHAHPLGACRDGHDHHAATCSICKLSASLHATGLTPPPPIPAPEQVAEQPAPTADATIRGADVPQACRAPPR